MKKDHSDTKMRLCVDFSTRNKFFIERKSSMIPVNKKDVKREHGFK